MEVFWKFELTVLHLVANILFKFWLYLFIISRVVKVTLKIWRIVTENNKFLSQNCIKCSNESMTKQVWGKIRNVTEVMYIDIKHLSVYTIKQYSVNVYSDNS